jgi:hypothetical protein
VRAAASLSLSLHLSPSPRTRLLLCGLYYFAYNECGARPNGLRSECAPRLFTRLAVNRCGFRVLDKLCAPRLFTRLAVNRCGFRVLDKLSPVSQAVAIGRMTPASHRPHPQRTLHKDRTGGDLFLFTHLTVGLRFYLLV